jgi:hypothetical protein
VASYAQNLIAIRDGIAALIAAEVAYEQANGARPDYSIDGQSVSWPEWYEKMLARLEDLEKRIQRAGGPFLKVSYGRA